MAATRLRSGSRPVGGEDDQRDAGLIGLDHGGVEVGGRRPARAGDDGRHPGAEGRAEGREAGAALVDDDRQLDRGLAVEGQGDR
jgi:hypothetical protein